MSNRNLSSVYISVNSFCLCGFRRVFAQYFKYFAQREKNDVELI